MYYEIIVDLLCYLTIYFIGFILSYGVVLGWLKNWRLSRSLNDPIINFEDFPLLWESLDFDNLWGKILRERRTDYLFSLMVSLLSWLSLVIAILHLTLSNNKFPNNFALRLSRLPDKEEFREFVRNS